MIRSMTGYGIAKWESPEVDITVEIRSVNSRYFDCSIRLPRMYNPLEDKVRSYIQTHATARGKVEVNLTFDHHTTANRGVSVDHPYAESYIAALRDLVAVYDVRDDISVMSLARNPEIFTQAKSDVDIDATWEMLLPVLENASKAFFAMREAEGAKTEADIKEKLERVRAWSQEIAILSKANTHAYRDKLETRIRTLLSDMGAEVDENRLLTECAIWADKIAVDEELVRLNAHFGAFYEICSEPVPSGKKLDFLMQELNRETNTIGSKSSDAIIAKLVVNMKNELEKIREQVQNIE